MHSGFHNLRSALPMNLKARHKTFKIFSGARPDVERIKTIWTECLEAYGGPYLFGALSVADAMYAPVCTRFRTYAVELDPALSAYLREDLRLAADAGMDRRRDRRARRDHRARRGVLEPQPNC